MKHIDESIIGRKGSQTILKSGSVLELLDNQDNTTYPALFLNRNDANRMIFSILELYQPEERSTVEEWIKTDQIGIIIWCSKIVRIRYFIQGLETHYKITNNLGILPIRWPKGEFIIKRKLGHISIDRIKNLAECFRSNDYFYGFL